MRPWAAPLFTLGAVASACAGKYEVGEVMALGGGTPGDLTSPGGASSTSEAMGGGSASTAPSVAGSLSAGPGLPALGPDCTAAGAPPGLVGPFAPPSVVWQRLSQLIGRRVEPPSPLPATTTEEWASSIVAEALLQAASEGAVVGAEAFVRSYLGLDSEAKLLGGYPTKLAGESQVVPVLLSSFLMDEEGSIIDGRQGVFTEPDWLTQYSTISARGHAMRRALFRETVASHPDGDYYGTPAPPAGTSDRQAIEQQASDATCRDCHRRIDPLGFALGHFDVAGDYRETDDGLEIDTSGDVLLPSGETLEFTDLSLLSVRLTNNCEANLGVSDAFLSFALTEQGYSGAALDMQFASDRDRVRQVFVDGGLTYLALLGAYARSAAALLP